ncbi:MAG TPA: cytochrome c oxidase subunit II [Bryobacteraceae bacterium]|jgi:cytochrome c oxidase subunit 2|nr:cytochrome c oxidase subunit II [Bryobacteraceae bacterium]
MNLSGKRAAIGIVTFCVLLLAGCAGHQQSVIDPRGPLAGRTAGLWWFFFWLLAAIFVIVLVLTLWTLTRRHRGIEQEPLEVTHLPSEHTENRLTRVVAGATIATVVILFILLVDSVLTGKANADIGDHAKNAMVIELTGNQWWWQVQYDNPKPSRIVVSANEIHIPVGRPVEILGRSNDVIHSFWVPNLQGKRDLIPSRVTTEWIEADRPGAFRGQCAEFCGLQHAHMVLWVIAEPEDKFDSWLNAQLQPAVAPADPVKQRGQQVFLNHECIFCHTIRGTTASGQVAPDLTHFGSRRGIAANTLPNTLGNLGGWILDPQRVKPGNNMATVPIASEDLQPLMEYLESLK